jgi:hypothetical protein
MWFADVNVVNRVPRGGSGVMVWAGISYGQRTPLHFIDGNLNEQRYHGEILRPIVVPFIPRHHLMSQYDNARSHAARIWTQLLEAENVPVLPFSPDTSPIEYVWMLWIDVYDCVFQFLPNIQELHTAIEE